MTNKTITPPQVNQPKGSGSLEFDGLLAAFHAIVWATAEDDDPDLAYDEAGNFEAKKLQTMYRALQAELAKARELLEHMLKDDDMPVHWFAQRIDDFLSNQSAPADKGQGEPVALQHMAVAEDGKLRWMSGRKMQNCELYALPDGSAIRFPLYAEQTALVAAVMPERMEIPSEHAPAYVYRKGWNACLDEFSRLNSEQKP